MAARRRAIAVSAAFLWLALVALVFWHDRSKHALAAADRSLVERSARLLAAHERIEPDLLMRITYPAVSSSNGRTCVTFIAYRTDRDRGGSICYAANGEVLEERIVFPALRGRSIAERVEDAVRGD